MEALLTSIPWAGFGWGGLIVLVILMVIRGDLIPKGTHEQIVNDLRESLAIERKNNEKLAGALGLLADQYGTTTDKLFQALPLARGQSRDPDSRSDPSE